MGPEIHLFIYYCFFFKSRKVFCFFTPGLIFVCIWSLIAFLITGYQCCFPRMSIAANLVAEARWDVNASPSQCASLMQRWLNKRDSKGKQRQSAQTVEQAIGYNRRGDEPLSDPRGSKGLFNGCARRPTDQDFTGSCQPFSLCLFTTVEHFPS
jgi:hypothetical protein